MTAIDLLSLLSITTPTACAIIQGRAPGIVGILTGFLVGAALGVAGCWGVRALFKRAALHPKLGEGTTRFWRFLSYLLLAALHLSLFVSSFLAMFITKALIHHVAA
jgi:hypothetical protein